MYWLWLAFKFLTFLRFPKNKNVYNVIERRYGRAELLSLRQWEKEWKRHEKALQDLQFLRKCTLYGVFPKFLRFKLYNRRLENAEFYRRWQKELLLKEIAEKERLVSLYDKRRIEVGFLLKQNLSFLDFNFLLHFVYKSVSTYIKNVKRTHANKLFNLGVPFNVYSYDINKVVRNFSEYPLCKREKELLAYGLEHSISPKISKVKYFTNFEILANRLYDEPIFSISRDDILIKLKEIAYDVFNKFRKEKKINLFSDEDIQVLKKLGDNNELHITRPDKGRGVIILDKKDYLDKMETILSDPRIFENCSHDDPKLKILRTEDKINRFIKKLKDKGSITENEYKNLYVCGSSPSVLYGLPKVHKLNLPLRPIVSSVNTPQYKLAKFIIPEISNLSKNEYVLENSKDLINSVSHLDIQDNHFMCSFDVESLFTNIPLKETINIVVNSIYNNNNNIRNMNRNDFKKLLELITEDNYIIFNNKFVRQKEGLAMGNPVSAVFANIFMCYHEKR